MGKIADEPPEKKIKGGMCAAIGDSGEESMQDVKASNMVAFETDYIIKGKTKVKKRLQS